MQQLTDWALFMTDRLCLLLTGNNPVCVALHNCLFSFSPDICKPLSFRQKFLTALLPSPHRRHHHRAASSNHCSVHHYRTFRRTPQVINPHINGSDFYPQRGQVGAS